MDHAGLALWWQSAGCKSAGLKLEVCWHRFPPAPLGHLPHLQGQKLSLGGAFTAGALVSSVGKWLDRGLTAMMGGGDAAGEAEG